MNLWGKRKGLLFLSALFFFFACNDELDKIGSFETAEEYEIFVEEFILPSTTVLFDSVRTDNTDRMLVGRYSDPLFGNVNAVPYIVYYNSASRLDLRTTVNVDTTVVNGEEVITKEIKNVIIDSITFTTKLNNYHYGQASGQSSNLGINIYMLNETLDDDAHKFNNTIYERRTDPVGYLNIDYNTTTLDTISSANDTLVYSTRLTGQFVEEFKMAIDAVTLAHPTEKALNEFGELVATDSTVASNLPQHLYGLTLESVSETYDVLGLSLANSSLVVHYRTEGSQEGNKAIFTFSHVSKGHLNFNNISSDRTGTPIDGIITDAANEFDGVRYVQAGTGIMTSFSLDEVLAYMEAPDRENLIVNRAELLIDGVINSEQYKEPSSISFYATTSSFDRTSLPLLGEDVNFLYNDGRARSSVPYDSANQAYSSLARQYFQDLNDYNISSAQLRIQPENLGYSLERFAINDENIRLRLYYSLPK